jgi:hypothetical protein
MEEKLHYLLIFFKGFYLRNSKVIIAIFHMTVTALEAH